MATSKTRAETDRKEIPLNVESIDWGGLNWTHIEQPTERETEYLAEKHTFHPLNLEDVLSRIQRPKIDEYPDHNFIVLRFPVVNSDTEIITSCEMDVFIGQNYLVTVDCEGKLKTLSKFFRLCETSEEARREHFCHGSSYLLYHIMDRMVYYCLPILNKTMDNIEQVEDNIFNNNIRGCIRDISLLRRNIISLRRIIWPMRAVIARLQTRIARFTDTDLDAYFGDIIDHVDRIWDTLEEYKEVTEGLNSTHDSLASSRINDVLRVLTILATIGTVLTVVASFYGMNIPLPGGGTANGNPFSWVMVLVLMLFIMAGMLYYFRRKHWL